jgi:hypothetical protein
MDGPLYTFKKKRLWTVGPLHTTKTPDFQKQERERLNILTRPPVGPTRQPRGVRSVGGARPEDLEAGERGRENKYIKNVHASPRAPYFLVYAGPCLPRCGHPYLSVWGHMSTRMGRVRGRSRDAHEPGRVAFVCLSFRSPYNFRITIIGSLLH